MRRHYVLGVGVAIAVISVSCDKETDSGFSSEMEAGTLVARWAEDPASRTEIQPDGTTVMWSGEEHIRLFYGPMYTEELISRQLEKRKEAIFSGMIPNPNWPMTPGPLYGKYWALYPYDVSATCDGGSITFRIPSEQQGKAGSFADNFFPAIGTTPKWTGEPISFYNVCGGACFSVEDVGITSLTFKSAGGEALCGKVRVGFGADGLPEILEIKEGVDSVVVSAPLGGFVTGKKYYAALLPQTLPHGLVLKFHKGKMLASTTIDKQIVINRSRFGRLDGMDRGLDYVEDPFSTDPDDIIRFEDQRVGAICIAAFDFNGDRQLSYAEAASARTIEGVFSASRLYTSFDEFRFFTGITEIPDNCFNGCRLLKRISLPDSVKQIGEYAFSGCSSLETIAIGNGLSTIGYGAFSECTSLKHFHITSLCQWLDLDVTDAKLDPNSSSIRPPTVYDDTGHPFFVSGEGHLYMDGKEITFIDIPEGYRGLRKYAFYCCNSITEVSLPSGFRSLGSAFEGCDNLKTVRIPSLADWFGVNRSSLDTYYFRDGSLYSGAGIFGNCPFGEGVRLIAGGEIVAGHLVIPEGITEIPDNAFVGCGFDIREVTFPRSLRKIGRNAFYLCPNLTKVNIPNLDFWLGLEMSEGNVKIHYPGGHVGSIRTSASPFESSCGYYDTDGSAVHYIDQGLSIASSGGGHLFIDGEEVTAVSVPSGCTELAPYTFKNCTGITEVFLPEGMQAIGEWAFQRCLGLTDITIPESLKTVGAHHYSAFDGCTNLKRVHVPNLQTWMNLIFATWYSRFYPGGGFFSSSKEGHILLPGDEEIRDIVIPESTKSIGDYAFEYCVGLESITLEPTVPPTLGANAFLGVTCPIYVWTPCLEPYKKASGWKDYADLLTANPNTP